MSKRKGDRPPPKKRLMPAPVKAALILVIGSIMTALIARDGVVQAARIAAAASIRTAQISGQKRPN